MKFSEFDKKKQSQVTPPDKPAPEKPPPAPPKEPPADSPAEPEPSEREVAPPLIERELPTKTLFSQMNAPTDRGPGPDRPVPSEGSRPPYGAQASGQQSPAAASATAKARAAAAYGRAMSLARAWAQDPSSAARHAELPYVVRELLDCVESGDFSLLILACVKSSADNYLYAHSVNVAILSLHSALGLAWNREELLALGAAGFRHDLDGGAWDEFRENPTHSPGGKLLADHFRDVQRAWRQTSGKSGARDVDPAEPMSRPSQILCICDVFEANTHPRDWRPAMTGHDALKKIVRGSFPGIDDRGVKYFLERLSLYPPGSFVQLSTGEIATVIGVHPELPTRPVLEVRIRTDGSREAPGVLLDLAKMPVLHVAKAVDETALPLKDKKLLMQFQANRWWNE